jgi:hypothetical protein
MEEEQEPAESSSDWKRPELGSMGRYGGADVYQRRRLLAIGGVILVILLLFLLLGGC